MSDRGVQLLLLDILEAINKILTYTEGFSLDEFAANQVVIDAVVRNFEIIGEAANRIPKELKQQNPNVEWHKIKGLRNRIVHDYFDVDIKIVWTIKETFLKQLLADIRNILDTYTE